MEKKKQSVWDDRDFYEQKVLPLIRQVQQLCAEKGLTYLMAFEVLGDGLGADIALLAKSDGSRYTSPALGHAIALLVGEAKDAKAAPGNAAPIFNVGGESQIQSPAQSTKGN